MHSNKIFQYTFLISLAVHGFLLTQTPNFFLPPERKEQEQPEVSYLEPPAKTPAASIQAKPLPQPVATSRMIAKKITPPPFIDKEGIFKKETARASGSQETTKPGLAEPTVIPVKKIITLPPVNLDKIDNPSYVSYYQIVREKIRRAAYQHYARTETGEVYLTFIISKEG
ncbi:MAG: hypothetical protein PHR11_07565, partial [Candidatus Omnitrophica bacterium]|nr:hypothetical protein [Candidatus Omnitrophota bacterium]